MTETKSEIARRVIAQVLDRTRELPSRRELELIAARIRAERVAGPIPESTWKVAVRDAKSAERYIQAIHGRLA